MATTQYTWEPVHDVVLQEWTGSADMQRTYTSYPEIWGPLLQDRTLGASSTYHHDATYSTREVTDQDGTRTDTLSYDAWGDLVLHVGGDTTPYLWVGALGYRYNPTLKTTNIRARDYSPKCARWRSRDPSLFRDGPNVYMMCGNSPVTANDPSGMTFRMKERFINLNRWVLAYSSGPTLMANRAADYAFRWLAIFPATRIPKNVRQLWLYTLHTFTKLNADTCRVESLSSNIGDVFNASEFPIEPTERGPVLLIPDRQEGTYFGSFAALVDSVSVKIGFDDGAGRDLPPRLSQPFTAAEVRRMAGMRNSADYTYQYSFFDGDKFCKCLVKTGWLQSEDACCFPKDIVESLDTPWFFAENEDGPPR